MKLFWTVCQIDGLSKRICRVLIVNILLLKSGNCFEHMEIEESVYEDFIEPSYKNLLGKMISMIVAAEKW